MDTFWGKGFVEIFAGLLGIATIAVLISNSKGTAQVISATTQGFSGLLRTVTLQDNVRNAFNG